MKTVLIVDDFASVRIYHQLLLKQGGYTTLTARDGVEALEVLNAQRPDLVMLDLVMPNMSGADFLTQARALPGQERLPVIIVSSEAQRQDAVALQAQSNCRVLQKPVPPHSLLEAVRELLS